MPSCGCNAGVSGLGINIDWTKIGVEQATDIIKRLPNENVMEIIKGLPIDVQKKICGQGVAQEVSSYIPWLVGGGVAILVGYMLLK
jgi:hypothetical protein